MTYYEMQVQNHASVKPKTTPDFYGKMKIKVSDIATKLDISYQHSRNQSAMNMHLPPIIHTTFPAHWNSDTVIMEGMFLIKYSTMECP